jgi:hypothetical protein
MPCLACNQPNEAERPRLPGDFHSRALRPITGRKPRPTLQSAGRGDDAELRGGDGRRGIPPRHYSVPSDALPTIPIIRIAIGRDASDSCPVISIVVPTVIPAIRSPFVAAPTDLRRRYASRCQHDSRGEDSCDFGHDLPHWVITCLR